MPSVPCQLLSLETSLFYVNWWPFRPNTQLLYWVFPLPFFWVWFSFLDLMSSFFLAYSLALLSCILQWLHQVPKMVQEQEALWWQALNLSLLWVILLQYDLVVLCIWYTVIILGSPFIIILWISFTPPVMDFLFICIPPLSLSWFTSLFW